MEQTDNYKLNKPELTEAALIDKLNENADIVDEELANRLPLSGGTMTGELILSAAPSKNLGAATKKYVDDAISGIDLGEDVTVDSELSGTSTNPVQNKAIKSALDGYLPLSGGTMTGTLGMDNGEKTDKIYMGSDDYLHFELGEGVKIDNDVRLSRGLYLSADPSDELEAATKQYVDSAVSGIDVGDSVTVDSALSSTSTNPVQNKVINSALSEKLPLSGGTMTGALTLSADPTEDLGAATKQYVDSASSPFYADIVIASSDTPEELQINADYVIDTDADATTTIYTALKSLSESGGKIVLLSGTYNCVSNIGMTYSNIVLQGCGASTVLNLSLRFYGNQSISGVFEIRDMRIKHTSTSSPLLYMIGTTPSGGTIKFCNNYIETAHDGLVSAYSTSVDGHYNFVFMNNIVTGTTNYYSSGGYVPAQYNNILVGNVFDDGFSIVAYGEVRESANIGLCSAKRTHVVVAMYNSKNPLKYNADYIIGSNDNATEILQEAVDSLAVDGKVELLDGTYNMAYDADAGISGTVTIATKGVTIEGSGYNTVINQTDSNGEGCYIFDITANDVILKNMMLSDTAVSSPKSMVCQEAQGAIYNNIFFIYNASESTAYSSSGCIMGAEADCCYTRIQDCRVYKGFKDGDDEPTYMFDFSNSTYFGGVISGNISSGYGDISVDFGTETKKNNTAVYGHTAITLNPAD